MDEYQRICPICLQVPEKEIYQCVEGHIICDLCFSKNRNTQFLYGVKCPTCKIPFGNLKIRSRILEQILDTQLFQCRFNDKGCTHYCKREKITSHANDCPYNPDVPLCEQMGFKDCTFKLGSVSRSQVISHFVNVHYLTLLCRPMLTVYYTGEELRNRLISRKRKIGDVLPSQPQKMWSFLSKDNSETSPLFLTYGTVNNKKECLSFVCVQVWGPGPEKYNVDFSLNIVKSPGPASATLNATNQLLPMRWNLRVCTIKDAHYFLKEPPVNISIPFLNDIELGISTGTGLNKRHVLEIKVLKE